MARLSEGSMGRLEELIADEDAPRVDGARGGRGLLAELKADPVRVGLDTLLREVEKLGRVRAVGKPDGLFAGSCERLVEA